jgi:stalled ribosome rescue protein Dom34
MSQHAIVFLDHHQARIFHLDGSSPGSWKLSEASKRETDHRHHSDGKKPSHEAFFHAVAQGLRNAREILVVGPGTAKSEFKHHLESHDSAIDKHVVGVESVDHPNEAQLIALAKRRFKAIDQWL